MRRLDLNFGRDLSIENQLYIWSKLILEEPAIIGKMYCNPCRIDNNPTCPLSVYKGSVCLVDFSGVSNKSLFMYEAICQICELETYDEFYSLVIKTLEDGEKDIECNTSSEYTVERKSMAVQPTRNQKGNIVYGRNIIDYYSTYGISVEDLYKSKAYPVWYYTIEDRIYEVQKDLCVVLKLQDAFKIYYPLRSENKWFSNTTKDNYWYFKGTDTLVITTSHKDALVVHINTGYSVYAPVSEKVHYTTEQLNLIRSHKRIISLGDGDSAGESFNEYNRSIFKCEVIDISLYSDNINSFGKKTKDISEIYRYDKQLCLNLLNDK